MHLEQLVEVTEHSKQGKAHCWHVSFKLSSYDPAGQTQLDDILSPLQIKQLLACLTHVLHYILQTKYEEILKKKINYK